MNIFLLQNRKLWGTSSSMHSGLEIQICQKLLAVSAVNINFPPQNAEAKLCFPVCTQKMICGLLLTFCAPGSLFAASRRENMGVNGLLDYFLLRTFDPEIFVSFLIWRKKTIAQIAKAVGREGVPILSCWNGRSPNFVLLKGKESQFCPGEMEGVTISSCWKGLSPNFVLLKGKGSHHWQWEERTQVSVDGGRLPSLPNGLQVTAIWVETSN